MPVLNIYVALFCPREKSESGPTLLLKQQQQWQQSSAALHPVTDCCLLQGYCSLPPSRLNCQLHKHTKYVRHLKVRLLKLWSINTK